MRRRRLHLRPCGTHSARLMPAPSQLPTAQLLRGRNQTFLPGKCALLQLSGRSGSVEAFAVHVIDSTTLGCWRHHNTALQFKRLVLLLSRGLRRAGLQPFSARPQSSYDYDNRSPVPVTGKDTCANSTT